MIQLTTQYEKCFLNVDGRRIAECPRNSQDSYSFSVEEVGAYTLIGACHFNEIPNAIRRIFFNSVRSELIEFDFSIGREDASTDVSTTVHCFIALDTWTRPHIHLPVLSSSWRQLFQNTLVRDSP
jgi:hypothetical protein